MKFKTQYNQDEFPHVQEKNEGPSESVPDRSMSVAELLRRYSNGTPVEGNKGVFDYDDDDEHEFLLPNLAAMDLTERQELLDATRAEVERLRAEMNEKHRQITEQANAEAKEKEFNAWMERKMKAKGPSKEALDAADESPQQ